jgi:hypothetical protein
VLNGYCKFLKLSNGDEIIVTTDNNCSDYKNEKYIHVIDPVEIKAISIAKGPMVVETHVMQPWIRLAKDDIIQIPTDSIVVAVDVEDDVITQYARFVYEEFTKKTPPQDRQEVINDMFEQMEGELTTDGDEEESPTFH